MAERICADSNEKNEMVSRWKNSKGTGFGDNHGQSITEKQLANGNCHKGDGADGKIRVVDVKTKSGVFRRPTAKICRVECLEQGEES